MKIKISFFLLTIVFITSCENADKKTHSNTLIDTIVITKNKYSSDTNTITNNKLEIADISNVIEKMKAKKELLDLDYLAIDSFILKNNDESKSEEFGYTLFEYLKKNKLNNQSFAIHLNNKEKKYQENFLVELIKMMCIDIGEDNYSYENFIKDFEIFKNSNAVKIALKDCIENNVE